MWGIQHNEEDFFPLSVGCAGDRIGVGRRRIGRDGRRLAIAMRLHPREPRTRRLEVRTRPPLDSRLPNRLWGIQYDRKNPAETRRVYKSSLAASTPEASESATLTPSR